MASLAIAILFQCSGTTQMYCPCCEPATPGQQVRCPDSFINLASMLTHISQVLRHGQPGPHKCVQLHGMSNLWSPSCEHARHGQQADLADNLVNLAIMHTRIFSAW